MIFQKPLRLKPKPYSDLNLSALNPQFKCLKYHLQVAVEKISLFELIFLLAQVLCCDDICDSAASACMMPLNLSLYHIILIIIIVSFFSGAGHCRQFAQDLAAAMVAGFLSKFLADDGIILSVKMNWFSFLLRTL